MFDRISSIDEAFETKLFTFRFRLLITDDHELLNGNL